MHTEVEVEVELAHQVAELFEGIDEVDEVVLDVIHIIEVAAAHDNEIGVEHDVVQQVEVEDDIVLLDEIQQLLNMEVVDEIDTWVLLHELRHTMQHEDEVEIVVVGVLDELVEVDVEDVIGLYDALLQHTEVDDEEDDIQEVVVVVVLDETDVKECLLYDIEQAHDIQ